MGIIHPKIEIIEEGDKLVILGNYKPVKNKIKEIDGNRWNPIRKCWTVPNTVLNRQRIDIIRHSQ